MTYLGIAALETGRKLLDGTVNGLSNFQFYLSLTDLFPQKPNVVHLLFIMLFMFLFTLLYMFTADLPPLSAPGLQCFVIIRNTTFFLNLVCDI